MRGARNLPGEFGWDVKSGEEQGAAGDDYPTDQLGGPYIGETGWDEQT